MGTYINGIWYDDYGQTAQTPTPSGIGGAPTGRASWYDPARDAQRKAAGGWMSSGYQYTPMPDQELALTRNPNLQYNLNNLGVEFGANSPGPYPTEAASLPAGYDPNAPLAPIGGVQNDPRYATAPVAQPMPAAPTMPQFPSGPGMQMPQFNTNLGMPSAPPYTPPPAAPGSATAANPFLGLGLNAFTNTQQPWDPSYLKPLAGSMWNQAMQRWNDTTQPSLNNQNIASGGLGGDRNPIAEGVMMDRLNQSVFNAIAPQYAQGYENWANRGLAGGQAAAGTGTNLESLDINRQLGLGNLGVSAYNADTSRQLGLGNLNLGQYQADTQRQLGVGAMNTSQYQADTQRQLGLGDLANKNYLAQGQVANWANQAANPQYSNPWGAAIGGGLLGYQLLNSILGNKP